MNILVVEDDFRIGEMYKEYLSSNAELRKVECVLNATSAIKYLEKNSVDIVIIDIYLPDLTGDKLAEKILKRHPYTNFIIISANQDADIIKKLLNLGILYYLVKPVKLEKLGYIVNQFIETNKRLDKQEILNQEQIDEYFRTSAEFEGKKLPKGIDSVSLEKIKAAFENQSEWSSTKLGLELGTSRTTVRRYLEYLREQGQLTVTQEFGDKGRPEKIYKK